MIRLNALSLPVCAAVVSQLQGRKRQLGPQNSKLRKQYDDLVFSPLDKNTGAVFICCPYCTYHDRLKNTFIENASYKAYRTEAARSIPDNNISSFLATEHQVANQFHYFTEKKPEHYTLELVLTAFPSISLFFRLFPSFSDFSLFDPSRHPVFPQETNTT